MEFPAIRFDQADLKGYVCVAKVGELVTHYTVDTFDYKKNPDGYQRTLVPTRARAFSRFILNGESSPTALLFSIREDESNGVSMRDGRLHIPDESRLELVDGQHRMAGYEEAMKTDSRIAQLQVPVIIINGVTKYQEAKEFAVINRNQKGVPADLAETFLQKALREEGMKTLASMKGTGALFRDVEWRVTAVNLADALNADTQSPWFERIRAANATKDGTTISQKGFTDSLQPVLKSEAFSGVGESTLKLILRNYWNAIRTFCPGAFSDPENYVIQRMTGAVTMHRLLIAISKQCVDSAGNKVYTEAKFKEILKPIASEYLSEEFWKTTGYAGERAGTFSSFRLLSDILINAVAAKFDETQRKTPGIVI